MDKELITDNITSLLKNVTYNISEVIDILENSLYNQIMQELNEPEIITDEFLKEYLKRFSIINFIFDSKTFLWAKNQPDRIIKKIIENTIKSNKFNLKYALEIFYDLNEKNLKKLESDLLIHEIETYEIMLNIFKHKQIFMYKPIKLEPLNTLIPLENIAPQSRANKLILFDRRNLEYGNKIYLNDNILVFKSYTSILNISLYNVIEMLNKHIEDEEFCMKLNNELEIIIELFVLFSDGTVKRIEFSYKNDKVRLINMSDYLISNDRFIVNFFKTKKLEAVLYNDGILSIKIKNVEKIIENVIDFCISENDIVVIMENNNLYYSRLKVFELIQITNSSKINKIYSDNSFVYLKTIYNTIVVPYYNKQISSESNVYWDISNKKFFISKPRVIFMRNYFNKIPNNINIFIYSHQIIEDDNFEKKKYEKPKIF